MAYAEVILTENIPNLGSGGRPGKGPPWLRTKFSDSARKGAGGDAGSLRKINHLKAKRAEREGRELTAAEQLAGRINKMVLEFTPWKPARRARPLAR